MNDAGAKKKEGWAQTWIDEQRELLKKAANEQSEAPENRNFAALLDQVGAAWFSSCERILAGFTKSPIALGWAREHEQAWRELTVAQAEYRKLEAELLAKLLAVQTDALDRLERSVRARLAENRPLADMRELYDLWIECGEAAYGEVARSDEYCRLQAALGNASVRLRAQQQKILERGLKHFDLPTRAELNSVHRDLRALRERVAQLSEPPAPSTRRSKRTTRAAGRARTATTRRTRTS